jgi:hypothetical protein
VQEQEVCAEVERAGRAVVDQAVVEAAEREAGDVSERGRQQERRQGDDPDPGQAVEQIGGAIGGAEASAGDQLAGDKRAAQHEEGDDRLVGEPGQEEEGPHVGAPGAGHVAAVGADRVQAEMAEQDQEGREPADVVQDSAELRREPGGRSPPLRHASSDPSARLQPCVRP